MGCGAGNQPLPGVPARQTGGYASTCHGRRRRPAPAWQRRFRGWRGRLSRRSRHRTCHSGCIS